jgi:hypothetical protein|tara:strand:- start:9 stop:164 length:156 start_codon:yes stop_codon:yes gene_type:complete
MNISNDLLNALLNYLGKRPYNESFMLIDKIRKELNADAPENKKPQLKEVKK